MVDRVKADWMIKLLAECFPFYLLFCWEGGYKCFGRDADLVVSNFTGLESVT